MPCSCGSYSHKRSTHKDCPLNGLNKSPAIPQLAEPVPDEVLVVTDLNESLPSDIAMPNHENNGTKRKSWIISTSFEETYPSLYEEVSKPCPKAKSLKKILKKIITPLIAGGDVYKFSLAIAKSLECLVHEFRESQNLPQATVPAEAVATEITGAVLGGTEMTFAAEIAAEMPLHEFDIRASMHESIQQCYSTTNTTDFAQALEKVIEYHEAFLYAVRMFKKTKTSKHMEQFLYEYSMCLYLRHVKTAELKITFD